VALRRYGFPGNVRELANVIERAALLVEEDAIHADDLGLPADAPRPGAGGAAAPAPGQFVLPEEGVSLEGVERDLIRQALERSGGNKSHAARLLGLSRATLRYRLEKLNLT
jgi:two-component system NtrC family response regulator